ncbi:uncharacterized protein [Branchiostoma lanceolatum]|uniref:uncharacterized protein n=1 Tax=Branchiostoma lanceolatum TaxID=7740 RepID=UPI0034539AB8
MATENVPISTISKQTEAAVTIGRQESIAPPPPYDGVKKRSNRRLVIASVVTIVVVLLVVVAVLGGIALSRHHNDNDKGTRRYKVEGEVVEEEIEVSEDGRQEVFHVPKNGKYEAVTVLMDFQRNLATFKDPGHEVCYVAEIDPDDWIEPQRLRKMIEEMNRENTTAPDDMDDGEPENKLVAMLPPIRDLQSLAGPEVAQLCKDYTALRIGPENTTKPRERRALQLISSDRQRRQLSWGGYTWGGGRHSISCCVDYVYRPSSRTSHTFSVRYRPSSWRRPFSGGSWSFGYTFRF